jgi:1-acyl-sn-glycerol-3-phosphate acyltransferase
MGPTGQHGSNGEPPGVALSGGASQAPVALREHLPGLEPERHVSDWGRSEFVEGALDRFVYDFLFHYWFRVEVEGITGVPVDGPGLLVANHAGALPADAAMIAKAIRDGRPGARPVHFATDRRLGTVPGLDMMIVKAGGVSAHPANLQRLLFDEGQLVLAFPEAGPAGALRARYRLRPFDRLGPLRVALQAGVPIIPIAVLGSEEAVPVLGRLGLGRLRRLPLAGAVPLPAKLRVRFLDPVMPVTPVTPAVAAASAGAVDSPAPADADAETLAADLRSLIQENLLEMLSERRSVWLG